MNKLLTTALLLLAVEGQDIWEAVRTDDIKKIGQILESKDFDINATGPGG